MHILNIHAILNHTEVNGPGDRMAIWTQGCSKGCKGCFNPHTWSTDTESNWIPEKLAELVKVINPEGLTLTGGDPLEQPEALLEFLQALHTPEGALDILPKGIICFTGYTIEEIEELPEVKACLPYIDLVIDGRYIDALRFSNGLAGSSNQRFHFLKAEGRGEARIPEEVITIDQEMELHFEDDDAIQVTGFPEIDRARLKELGIKMF